MSEIKNSLEAFGTLTTENLQRATVSRNIEDIFAARIYAQAKIQGLVENGAKTFSERVELKQMRLIDDLLGKRYNKIRMRKDQKQDRNNKIKQQRIELHKLIDSDLVYSLVKENAKKRKIIYSRYTKPAKQLLELAGSVEKAKEAINTVANWANSRKLDYTIETVFKKWLELDRLKPKEIVKKPFYRGDPMIWSETKKKWYVISKYGEWLEFADKESTIEWKTID